ncbi:DDB1 and CUL4-associated factor 4 [Ixodes scapularis]
MSSWRQSRQQRRKRRQASERHTSPPAPEVEDEAFSDLPGFYYDAELKRYFRLLPGCNRNNPVTRATIRAKRAEQDCERIVHESLQRNCHPLPRSLTSLQLGRLGTGKFTDSVRSAQMASLQLASEIDLSTTADRDDVESSGGVISGVEECAYLVGHPGAELLIGSWATKTPSGQRGSLVRTLRVTGEGIKPGRIVNVHPQHKVVDVCVASRNGRPHALYACVNTDCTTTPSSFVALHPIGPVSSPRDYDGSETREYAGSAVWCCAVSPDASKSAVGLERRAEVHHGGREPVTDVWTRGENPLSLVFSADGNLVYAGTHKGSVFCVDLRDRPGSRCAYEVAVGRGVSYLGLVGPADTLLASAYDGKLVAVYLPCVLQTKKRYVGFSYESPDQTEPTYDAKGIETVRRDTCPAVSKLLEKSLRLLFAAGEVAPVKNYLKLQFSKMLSEQVNLQDFIFAKEFRGLSGYKPGACVPALEIARRMVRKDPRLEPRVGERVPYVVVYGSPGLRLIQLVRHPLEVLSDPSLRLNVHYYVTRAVGPALNRVLGLVGQDALQWYGELPRPASGTAGVVRGRGGPNTIGRYLVCQLCPACGAQSPREGLCPGCRADPGFAALALGDRVHRVQAALHDIQQICQSCMGFRGSECISTDCPILYKKARVTYEAKQARAWHNTNSTAQARGFASHH